MGGSRQVRSAARRGASQVVLVGLAVLAVVGLGSITPAGATPPTTWGPPTTVTGVNFYPQLPKVTIDAAGTATALWSGGDTYYDQAVRTSTQPVGGPWSPSVTLADEGEFPVLAGNSAGAAVAAWEANDGAIHASSRTAGGDWTPAATISVGADAVAKASAPRVAIDESGDAIVVWQQRGSPANEVWNARTSAGGSWSGSFSIATNIATDNVRPDVALDASGDAVVAWTAGGFPTATKVQARTSAGPLWGAVVDLDATPGASAGSPAVAMDDLGDAVVVWTHVPGSGAGLRSALRLAGGGWSPVADVAPGAPFSRPSVVSDAEGDTTALWSEATGEGVVVFAAERTTTTPWSPPVALSGPVGSSTGVSPVLGGNRAGDVTAVWEHRAGDPQRQDIQVSSRAAGGAWSTPVMVSGADQDASSTDVALNVDGEAVIAYLDRTFDALSPTCTVWAVRSPAPPDAPPDPPLVAPPVKLLPRFTG